MSLVTIERSPGATNRQPSSPNVIELRRNWRALNVAGGPHAVISKKKIDTSRKSSLLRTRPSSDDEEITRRVRRIRSNTTGGGGKRRKEGRSASAKKRVLSALVTLGGGERETVQRTSLEGHKKKQHSVRTARDQPLRVSKGENQKNKSKESADVRQRGSSGKENKPGSRSQAHGLKSTRHTCRLLLD